MGTTPAPFSSASPIDLTTLALVKGLAGVTSTSGDVTMQMCITAASAEFLRCTGAIDDDGAVPSESPYVTPVVYDEFYDGNGNDRLFLRHRPIRSVQALLVRGITLSAAQGYSRGYRIASDKRSLVFLMMRLPHGTEIVEAQYTAGYDATPADIVRAMTQMVAVNFKRKDWLDLASSTMGASGSNTTISYRNWEFPPEIRAVIRNYSRTAIV